MQHAKDQQAKVPVASSAYGLTQVTLPLHTFANEKTTLN